MSQSCETLITKINEWQKAILELEELSDEFLNSGDDKLKVEIENKKRKIVSREKEYQILAYPELPNGEKLFWPEREALSELFSEKSESDYLPGLIKVTEKGNIQDLYMGHHDLSNYKQLNLSLFQNLKLVFLFECKIKKLPNLPESIRRVSAGYNPGLEIPDDLTHLKNLIELNVECCGIEKSPAVNPGTEVDYLSW